MGMNINIYVFAMVAFAMASLASADEPTEETKPKDITDRYALVGVISGSQMAKKPTGIAVIKDEEKNKTLILNLGEYFGDQGQIQVTVVDRSRVIVKDNGIEKELVYRPSKEEEVPTQNTVPEEKYPSPKLVRRGDEEKVRIIDIKNIPERVRDLAVDWDEVKAEIENEDDSDGDEDQSQTQESYQIGDFIRLPKVNTWTGEEESEIENVIEDNSLE